MAETMQRQQVPISAYHMPLVAFCVWCRAMPRGTFDSGAEAKVQVKTMQGTLKELCQRLRVSDDFDEMNGLEKAKKKLSSIIEIVDAVRQHGLDSDGFMESFDLTTTRLLLDPQVALDLPPHVKYARHKATIRATDEPLRFLQRISSTELRLQDISAIAQEQELLLTERLSSTLKLKDAGKMNDCLLELFDFSKEYDMEEPVEIFAVSFGVLLRVCLSVASKCAVGDADDTLSRVLCEMHAHRIVSCLGDRGQATFLTKEK